MTNEQPITIHLSEITSVEEKLTALRQQLSPNEQVVLDWLLDRAAASGPSTPADAEVQGFFAGAYGTGNYTGGGSLSSALGLSLFNPALRVGLNPQPLPPRALNQRGIIVVGG
jgi:hypothetical protein